MSERSNPAFGFTVGPVMPAEQDGAAGDRQRYREMLVSVLILIHLDNNGL